MPGRTPPAHREAPREARVRRCSAWCRARSTRICAAGRAQATRSSTRKDAGSTATASAGRWRSRTSRPSSAGHQTNCPDDKPRHLLGISEPDDLFAAVAAGADTFDCVSPSRSGRNAAVYSADGRYNITGARYRRGLHAHRRRMRLLHLRQLHARLHSPPDQVEGDAGLDAVHDPQRALRHSARRPDPAPRSWQVSSTKLPRARSGPLLLNAADAESNVKPVHNRRGDHRCGSASAAGASAGSIEPRRPLPGLRAGPRQWGTGPCPEQPRGVLLVRRTGSAVLRHPRRPATGLKSTVVQRQIAKGTEPFGRWARRASCSWIRSTTRDCAGWSAGLAPKGVRARRAGLATTVTGLLDQAVGTSRSSPIWPIHYPYRDLPTAGRTDLDEPQFSRASALLAQGLDPFITFTGRVRRQFRGPHEGGASGYALHPVSTSCGAPHART